MGHSTHSLDVQIKRAYEHASSADGHRILVDGLWPRGVRKADARIEGWMKEIAPSAALRRWFGHDPARWEEFRRRYRAELAGKTPLLEQLRTIARDGKLTLLYAARDERHNQAVVLRDALIA